MADENVNEKNRAHILIDKFRETAAYEFPSRSQTRKPLREDYGAHAADLVAQLAAAFADMPPSQEGERLNIAGMKLGTVVEIETYQPPEGSRTLSTKVPTNLEFPAQEISVLRTDRSENRTETALLFVPDDAREFLRGRIEGYGQDPGNERRKDLDRFEAIEEMRSAGVKSLFTGDINLDESLLRWWEFWIRQPSVIADQVRTAAINANIDVHSERLVFPDTVVLFLHSTAADVATFASRIPGAVTEIRLATGTVADFLSRSGSIGPHDWVAELESRLVAPQSETSVVCVLDTGVNAAHPLLVPGLKGAWAYDAGWGADDHYPDGGHGTSLAGLALYGDLENLMASSESVQLTHGVESMKFLPPDGFPPTQPPSYGIVTQGAVSSVEIERPNVLRSFCIATSTTDFPPSRPSTWSGAIDQVASGSMPGERIATLSHTQHPKRLVLLATGNVAGGMIADVLKSHPLEDPSQSWNSLSIGGFTSKDGIPTPPPNFSAVVAANHRSPYSKGSVNLPPDLTPIKPEVLFEAGNMLSDALGFCGWHRTVSLLATGADFATEPLIPFWATSAAVGVAGHFVGQLQSSLHELWPETHRALVVDSARWPEPIRKNFVGSGAHWKSGRNGTKAKRQELLREFGYGVPDLQRAQFSAANDATMIAQAEIQPYAIGKDGRTGVFNEMHFYDLPWPKAALEDLENAIVVMKVTLSYFIEPNISGRAATRPDTYRSFGLRFEMKKRDETEARFRSRVSANQLKDGTDAGGEQSYWLLGPKSIQAGSLHCDLWRGYAADLASHDAIAIYPVGGWWKSHAGQKRITDKGRYSLVISISAPGSVVDLYSEIATIVDAAEIEVQLESEVH